jgi:polysaccharide pyruvyl transferase WcaK-like protein
MSGVKPINHRPRAFFSLKTQFENAGDALINRELLRLCAQRADVYLDLTRCPTEFVDSLGVNRFLPNAHLLGTFRLFAVMILSRVLGRDAYYFVSPGGYVGEKRGMAAVAALLNTVVLGCFSAIGVRVCHVGVSFERLGPFHRRILTLRARFMSRTVVRDEDSAVYARELGIRVDEVAPDLAFGAASYRPLQRPGSGIALSFRVDQLESQRADCVRLVRMMDDQLPPGVEFRFIAQVERDARFLRELSSEVASSRRPVSFHSVHRHVDSALDAYLGCQFVVSNRLHALLFGLLSGAIPVPTIHSEVNGKVVGLFNSIGISVATFDSGLPRAMTESDVLRGEIGDLVRGQLRALESAISNVFAMGGHVELNG